jgi:hypothetical protein
MVRPGSICRLNFLDPWSMKLIESVPITCNGVVPVFLASAGEAPGDFESLRVDDGEEEPHVLQVSVIARSSERRCLAMRAFRPVREHSKHARRLALMPRLDVSHRRSYAPGVDGISGASKLPFRTLSGGSVLALAG